jgi:hypothetical protein
MAYQDRHYVHEYRGRRFLILELSDGWHWLEDAPGNERHGPFRLKRDTMASASSRVDLDAMVPKKSLAEAAARARAKRVKA